MILALPTLPGGESPSPWLVAILVAAGAFGGWGLGRVGRLVDRRRRAESAPATPPPEAPPPPPVFAEALAAAEQVAPPPAFDPADIAIEVIAQRCTLTLATATLRYALVVSNHGPVASPPLLIGLEMTAAGATATPTSPARGPIDQHAFPALAPGHRQEERGQLTLPLTDGATLDLAGARLLVLLLRLRMGAIPAEALAPTANTRAPAIRVLRKESLLVGAASPAEGKAAPTLTPFPLDLAPGSWDRLVVRPIDPADGERG